MRVCACKEEAYIVTGYEQRENIFWGFGGFFFFLVFLLARSVLLYTCLVLNLIIHLADSAVVKYYVETTD